jgi:hypothetical protein
LLKVILPSTCGSGIVTTPELLETAGTEELEEPPPLEELDVPPTTEEELLPGHLWPSVPLMTVMVPISGQEVNAPSTQRL